MSSARLLGALVPVSLFVIAAVGAWWVLREERRNPTSYTRKSAAAVPARTPMYLGGEPTPEEWEGMATAGREAYDTAVLNAAEVGSVETLQVADKIFERFGGAVGIDDLIGGAIEKDDGVQDGEQEGMHAEFGGDQRKDGRSVGSMGGTIPEVALPTEIPSDPVRISSKGQLYIHKHILLLLTLSQIAKDVPPLVGAS